MVSVIIPHYNRLELLSAAIHSVEVQTFTDWEILIVDDHSDSEVRNALGKYRKENIRVYSRESNLKGPSACRNLGAKKAKGEFLIFLDSDDLLKPFCLEQRMEAIQKNSETGMCVFQMEEFRQTPGDLKTTFNKVAPFDELIPMFLQNKNPWQTMAPVWRKDFFFQSGGFDEQLLFMEDPDLHLRTLYSSPEKVSICYDNPSDCFYRIHHMDDSKKDFWYRSIYYRIAFFEKLIGGYYEVEFLWKYRKDIKRGVYSLINDFLYSRYNEFINLYERMEKWMRDSRLFSRAEIWRIKSLVQLGNRESFLTKRLKIKGICYRLLPRLD